MIFKSSLELLCSVFFSVRSGSRSTGLEFGEAVLIRLPASLKKSHPLRYRALGMALIIGAGLFWAVCSRFQLLLEWGSCLSALRARRENSGASTPEDSTRRREHSGDSTPDDSNVALTCKRSEALLRR